MPLEITFSTNKKLTLILEITTLLSQYFSSFYSQFKITFEIDNSLVKSKWHLQSPTPNKISIGIFVNKHQQQKKEGRKITS